MPFVQISPTSAVAPSADLVLWSRLGSDYDPIDLQEMIAARRIFELQMTWRPIEDLPIFRAEMAAWPGTEDPDDWRQAARRWVDANDTFRQAILNLLGTDGPLPAKSIPDSASVPWKSSGWNNNKNVAMMLDILAARGEVAVAGRRGRDRLWDLASRVYPDASMMTLPQARLLRQERRLQSLGIARARSAATPAEPNDVGEVGEPAEIDGVDGSWRVDPEQLEGGFRGRTALLSPLDRLVADRKRMNEIFQFDYFLEMYKPAAQRQWGYFALPVLHEDRLVGKVDVTTDRKAGVLRVNAVHWDTDPTHAMTAGVEEEIADLARFLGVEVDQT